jgi:hypothetical protein
MSTKRGDTTNVNEGFIRPDMPVTPGRCLLHLLCWLAYMWDAPWRAALSISGFLKPRVCTSAPELSPVR